MATQMFIQRGFEDGEVVKYATLPTPSGLSLTTIENNNNAEAKTDEASVALIPAATMTPPTRKIMLTLLTLLLTLMPARLIVLVLRLC